MWKTASEKLYWVKEGVFGICAEAMKRAYVAAENDAPVRYK